MPEDTTQPIHTEHVDTQAQPPSPLWYRISSVLLPIGTALMLCAAFVYVEDIGGIKSTLQRFTSGNTQTEEMDDSSWALPDDFQPPTYDSPSYSDVGESEVDAPQEESKIMEFPAIHEGNELDYAQYYKNLREQEGVVWFDAPQPRGELNLAQGTWNVYGYYEYRLQYYAIGLHDNDEILVTFVPCVELCFTSTAGMLVFTHGLKTDEYSFLTRYGQQYTLEAGADDYNLITLDPKVTIDRTTGFSALTPPTTLEELLVGESGEPREHYYGIDFSANTALNESVTLERYEHAKVTFVQDTLYGPLFRVSVPSHTMDESSLYQTEIVTYLLRMPGGLTFRYTQDLTFMGDDRVPQFTHVDGTVNSDSYRSDGRASCGAQGGIEVVRDDQMESLKNDLVVVGTVTNTGEPLYSVANPKHWLVRLAFGEVAREVYDSISRETKTMTPEEYLNNSGVVLYVDRFGQYVVLTNTRYGGGAECGKPVIYLYPESKTDVHVEVGADITVSVPPYNEGWSVVANQDGTLETEEGTFGSLYWDGIGYGEYPDVRTRGALVPRDQVEVAMRDDLYTLGFRGREIDEFIEFWMPHMPDTRFVRLTWLGTRDMDELAPLTIEPKPDTLIRAFLDFEGFDSPIVLKPQSLGVSLSREGFTAVEWGGLLRNPTHNK